MRFIEPLLGSINQGTVFTCARAQRYRNCGVHGIVITARCDLAQKKFPVMNYIPIVPIDHWLAVDGLEILNIQATKELAAKKAECLKLLGLSANLLSFRKFSEIIDDCKSDAESGSKIKKIDRQISDIMSKDILLEPNESGSISDVATFFTVYQKNSQKLIDDLIRHKVAGHYFLSGIDPKNPNDGFVALMRETQAMPREIAVGMCKGIDGTNLASGSPFFSYLDFDFETFSMPIAELRSPDIEHFMQSYSLLFSRIGLEDYLETYIETMKATSPWSAK